MKLFQAMQSYSKVMGFDRNQRPFNRIVLMYFGILGFQIIFYVVYFCTETNTCKEYNQAICFTSSAMVIANCFTTLSVKRAKAFEMIDQFEELIEKSEFNTRTRCCIEYWLKRKVRKCIFRISQSKIESDLHRSKSACRAIHGNFKHCRRKSDTDNLCVAKRFRVFLLLFYQRFEIRCFCIATPNVVCLTSFVKFPKIIFN